MKVLFINFNIGATAGINNGIAILSAALKGKGHAVSLIFICEELGYGFDLSRIEYDVKHIMPDLIGISLMEPQSKYIEDLCKDIRNYFKGFIICGGPYPTMAPDDVISVQNIDAVCVGEGEDALLELVEALEKSRDYSRIKNLWVKQKDGSVMKNRLRPFKNLAELPMEDKELFDLEKILPLKNYQLEMMLGRGCVYKCSYCINESYIDRYRELCEEPVSVKGYVRMKKIDTAIDEIKDAVARHPKIKKVAFIDDNFLIYSNFTKDFYRRYREEVALPFICNANPMSFNISNARLLKEAGCDDVRFGVESGSRRVKYDILKRRITNRGVKDAFRLCRELGMMTSSFNMIGLPTETREEVLETLRLNASITPDTVKVMTFYPFKNTPIYDLCVKEGLIDYARKRELDNYDTFSCLNFPEDHRLFLKKMQTAFNWYLNAFLENGASAEYLRLIHDIEAMTEEEWDRFDFYRIDEEASKRLIGKGVIHYSKFVNRSLAVKFPSRHIAKAGEGSLVTKGFEI